MNSGVRRTEEWTLYAEQDRPVVVSARILVFAGSQEVKHWQSGCTADGTVEAVWRRCKRNGRWQSIDRATLGCLNRLASPKLLLARVAFGS